MRDVKEVVGMLMRVASGAEATREEVEDLEFEATGELGVVLNEAYIALLEFAFDHKARLDDPLFDGKERSELEMRLARIAALALEQDRM